MFKDRLREARKSARFSQEELSKRLNISQSTVGNWESGIRQPDFDTVSNLALILDVSSDYLLGISSKEKPTTETGSGLSETEAKMLEVFRAIPEEQQDSFLDGVESFSKAFRPSE